SSTSDSVQGMFSPWITCVILAASSATRRRTLCSCLSMTDRAVMLTFSRASADRTLARRPGLFSRNTVTCLVVATAETSHEMTTGADGPAALRRLRCLRVRGMYCRLRRATVQKNLADALSPLPRVQGRGGRRHPGQPL